jgi:uncharacterized lipoprotein YmbA
VIAAARARKRLMAGGLALALAAGWLALGPACLRTTAVRYYTLSGDGPAAPARTGEAKYTVHVAPASVPEALDRPELVLRVSATELSIDDGHRWAEPLRAGIARSVAGGLGRQLGDAQVSASDENGTGGRAPDVVVTVDVQRLDVRLAVGAAIDVAWTARWANDGRTRTGRSVVHAPSSADGGYEGAVAACAAALDAVSNDIARAVQAEVLSRR